MISTGRLLSVPIHGVTEQDQDEDDEDHHYDHTFSIKIEQTDFVCFMMTTDDRDCG